MRFSFWTTFATFLLRHRVAFSVALLACTVFMVSQWKNIQFSFTEANLLPDDHPENILYNKFLDHFGEEGVVMLVGVQDSTLFSKEKFKAWNTLFDTIATFKEVDQVLSFSNVKTLVKDTKHKRFEFQNVLQNPSDSITKTNIESFKNTLFTQLPFYENILYNSKKTAVQSLIFVKQEIVNTELRRDFILKKINPLLLNFEKSQAIDLKISGMPYIRTLNSQNIFQEMRLFLLAALGITSFLFFCFFRSFSATLISIVTVVIGVCWAFGFLGLMHYQITVLTAVIPPLIIVIGIPNCVFLINKYQQEVLKSQDKTQALSLMISKVGYATLMTNVTTAMGFATFMLTSSTLLYEFGCIAALSILGLFVLCILVVPTLYSFMPFPKTGQLEHLKRGWLIKLIEQMIHVVNHHRSKVYIITLLLLIISGYGASKMKVSGSMLDEMSRKTTFFKDILFYEKEFGGVMPLEIFIDTKKEKGAYKLAFLKKMDRLDNFLKRTPELTSGKSITNAVKFAKQAYYKGNANYYKLPSNQERNFMKPYLNSFEGSDTKSLLSNYIDPTGRYARISTYMQDIGTERMQILEKEIHATIKDIFPSDRYEVHLTGRALLFQKGTNYLVKNLIQSLALAVLLIIVIMLSMFKSWRMILVALLPNLLPLLITAGLMGYLGLPIKPSTILVFSIAFGISVDDTIHFLAKYKQELEKHPKEIVLAAHNAIKEVGLSMFYTSTILFFGFGVFLLSGFGGTQSLGGLVSATLFFAMLSNLILLPTLLLSRSLRLRI